jgi:hypothetical protein
MKLPRRETRVQCKDDIMRIYMVISELSWPQINNVNQRNKRQGRDREAKSNSFFRINTVIKCSSKRKQRKI